MKRVSKLGFWAHRWSAAHEPNRTTFPFQPGCDAFITRSQNHDDRASKKQSCRLSLPKSEFGVHLSYNYLHFIHSHLTLSQQSPPRSSSSGADLNPWKVSRRRTTEQKACLADENSPAQILAALTFVCRWQGTFNNRGGQVESRASHRPRHKFLHELQGLVYLLAISAIYRHVLVNSIIHRSHSSDVGWHGRPAGLFIHLSSSLLHPVKDLVFRPPTALSCQRSVGEPCALSSAGIHTLEAGALFLLGKLCRLVCTVDVGSLRGGGGVISLGPESCCGVLRGGCTLTSPAPWMMSLVFSIALSLEPSPLRGMLGGVVGCGDVG